ncbi:MAG: exonuclease SbcCD subunit D [Chloroflexi bacterium]|nr:exonuclease SbcCD subunit D [Chloroflexota bacterium]
MKLLHLSDLHLGVETYGRIDPATGLNTRLLDALSALDEAVDFALQERADVFLFCGDAYKSRDPSQTQQREFARRISRLASSGIHVFLLAGNHDLPASPSRAHTMEIFAVLSSSKGHTLALENVTVASRPGTYLLQTHSGPLQVIALPWAQRRALLAKEEHKNLPLDQMNQRARDIVAAWLQEEYRNLREDIPAVLSSHLHVDSAKFGSERGMMLGHDIAFLKSSLYHPYLDYVALGHIHRHQALSEAPPIVYSGSLQAIDFSEEGEAKGFCLVEIDPSKPAGRRAEWSFHPVESRPFLTIEADAIPPSPTDALLRAIARYKIEDAIVRLKIKVAEDDRHLIDESALRKALAPAHFVAAIAWEVESTGRPRRGLEPGPGLTPAVALRHYLEVRGTAPERAQTLQEYGERLIQEAIGQETMP